MSLIYKAEACPSNSIEDDDDEEAYHQGNQTNPSPAHHNRSRPGRILASTARSMSLALAAWGLISLSIQTKQHLYPTLTPDVYRPATLKPPTLNLCDCGPTIRTALSKHCIYDSLATAWLPPHCRDDELTAEFDRAGPGPGGAWSYFADENGTVALDRAQVAALGEVGRSFWARRDWHVAHCLFYWEKYVRMRWTGVVMERRFDRAAHVRHCRRLVLNPRPDWEGLVEVPVVMSSGVGGD